ncbi:MAG: hypothetical protein WC520_02050 [Candidatus Paceibacterota bacterium]
MSNLPNFVAKSLRREGRGGNITASDVEVIVRDYGPFDHTNRNLSIIVWANEYPKIKNLNDRKRMLRKALESVLPSRVEGHVSIFLQPGSSGDFWYH